MQQGTMVLIAAMILTFVLGTIHAFSVSLSTLEIVFNTSRTYASLTYSLALLSLTVGVLYGHRLHHRLRLVLLVILIECIAILGCLIAMIPTNLFWVWLGYSVVFGFANGLGYGLSLQMAAQANPDRTGIAIGLITAFYALGAICAPIPFSIALDRMGWSGMMAVQIFALLLGLPFMIFLLRASGFAFANSHSVSGDQTSVYCNRSVVWLWFSYCTAVTSGLMVIGHAAAIAGTERAHLYYANAPTVVAAFNMLGSIFCGWLTDKVGARLLLLSLPLISAIVLIQMVYGLLSQDTLVGLAIMGFCYGGIITVYPIFIAKTFGADLGAQVYGYVFTAWGIAGLLGPMIAGIIYDVTTNYNGAMIIAGLIALTSTIMIYFFRIHRQEPCSLV